MPDVLRKKLKHGIKYESVAREKYVDIMKFKVCRNINVMEAGLVINPSLFWFGASPDGLVVDGTAWLPNGSLEVKCPETKKNCSLEELVADPTFYVHIVNNKPCLKKDHSLGYYAQVQFQMGICQLPWCDFVVYTYKGLIIIRVPFDTDYFKVLCDKVSAFIDSIICLSLKKKISQSVKTSKLQ